MALIDLKSGHLTEAVNEPAATIDTSAAGAEQALAGAALESNGPIAIRFPKFSDGRGFSLARLVREKHLFAGELRAVGHVIPDQAVFLLRSGFDTVEVRDAAALGAWRRALGRFSGTYQSAWRNPVELRRDAKRHQAEALADRLAGADRLEDRIAEVARSLDGRIAFSTSLQVEDQAILHAIAASGANVDIFTLDTGRLFPEVLETLQLSEARYGLRIRLVVPDAPEVEELVARDGVAGFRQSVEARKACCNVRKVRPLARALKGAAGWITGLRQEQSDARAEVPLAVWDAERGLIKVNPVADWTAERLNAYVRGHNVPVNPLHAKGYPSIGCQPCTRAVKPGEHPRAGRWWWERDDVQECGLHAPRRRQEAAA
jgi:phosphoadenosine phosphosulfate reductase